MKGYLLLVIACGTSLSMFAQTQNKTLKVKSKIAAHYSTTFTPISTNGKTGLKSAKVVKSTGLYSKMGASAFNIRSLNATNDKIIYGTDSLAPIYFERNKPSSMKSSKIQSANQRCFEFLDNIKEELKITNPSKCFTIVNQTDDKLGQQHIRLSQNYKGIKVYSSDFYVHFAGNKEILNGKYNIIGQDVNVIPAITKDQALKIVTNDIKSKTAIMEFTDQQKTFLNYQGAKIDTIILEDKKSFTKYSLAYHIIIRPNFIDEWYYFINAVNGEIIKKYNNTKNDGPAIASATDLNGVTRSINTYLENGNYTLNDASEPMYNATSNDGLIITLDAEYTPRSQYIELTSANNTWNNPTAVSAHYNAKQAYLYYKNTFDRNAINGSGGTIYSFINVTNDDGTAMDNAYWSDKIMCYGNGDVAFKPLAGGLDVAAHEMTHGVTQNTAALEYQGESGAINESISDVFATMVDRANWYIGEDITKTSYIATGRLRDLSNPHNGTTEGNAGWQPMHTSEMYMGSDDNGGVHTNSGISNYAYYLIASAITKEKAEKIYYRALTTYLNKSSQFIDLRLAVTQSTKDLYGDSLNEVKQVKIAFDSVGIYEEQKNNYTQSYPVNPGQDYLLVYNTDVTDTNTLYRSTVTATNFGALTSTPMKGKVSVVDDGSYAVFVSKDNKIRSITLDPANPAENVISTDNIWDNVAISKDGNRLAAITYYIDTAIYVYDFTSQVWAKYHLYSPSTDGGQKSGGVLYADAIQFDHTGEYLIFDSYNHIPSSSKDSISYWDIGLMKVWDNQLNKFGDGTISKLFSNLPDSVSIGNPVFSMNSPNIIAFDYLKGNNIFAVLGLNIENMNLGIIADNNTVGYPSYSKLDDKVAFNSLDNSMAPVVSEVVLNADKISSSVSPTVPITGAQWPVFYATGTRALGLSPIPNFTASYKEGSSPLNTTFFDQSTNDPTSWAWTFESGSPNTSNLQNPDVTYSKPGIYAVTLKATNNFGSNTVTKSGYIVISGITGLSEVKTNDKLKVYPNPTLGPLKISVEETLENDYKIEVFNEMGKLIQTAVKQRTDKVSEIDLSGNPSGIYLIRINLQNKSIQSRVIKR